ncbi:4-hydroxy-tetrahydrodipicolinate synthase [Pseudomonas duriflava]|uniref:4-hydroxy-tetrahydrodipicolinate synthase n=1 Tax=Pseudomonas duriflava TaxID=459528 RepID=A0A562PZU9_9PSED|nr:dihydrodipicolinate synthase family protein [Pseudomonas duriflava]TWI49606.1 4-hydroxy-tetrahydrodipicolinate synthase [Pseudomonas duriflava]
MTLLDASGIYTICPTPFDLHGQVDVDSIKTLVEFQIEVGVRGLAVLGFLGEAHKLTNAERRQVITAFVSGARGRVPVWVGVRALGIPGAIEQALEAQALGASAVFAAPLDGVSDAVLFDYYKALGKALHIPVIIHDFPDSFGTQISAEVVARLGREGGVNMIKMEEPPVGPKITRIRELAGDSMRVFGGLGGVYLLEELQRGAVGTMTGFAFPEVLVSIYDQFRQGNLEGAAATFDHYCPLLRYEFQPRLGLALRKYIYQQRGVIACDHVRAPGMRIDAYTRDELEAVVCRVGLSLEARGPQAVQKGA